MFKLDLEKAEATEIKLPTSIGSSKKQESSRKRKKKNYFCFIDYANVLIVWTTTNSGQCLKMWEYQTTWPASWETCMQVKKQQLKLGMEQQTGCKWRKEYVKPVYCHPAYLTSMQSTSWETLGWKKHKLESICRWHHPYGRKWRGTKKPLHESERGEWKSWLKAQHSENEDHGMQSHHFMANRWGNSGNSVRLYF